MLLIASFWILLGSAVEARQWQRNTFPGPGHVANPGPWGEGQGSDRTEWVSAFGVSPVEGQFMLQGTDLGRLVYTNPRLGGTEFLPATIPLHHVYGVAFHPVEGGVGYALMGQPGNDSFQEDELRGYSGWWRSTDSGESWSLLYPTIAPTRGQKRLLVVDPVRDALYIGTATNGLVRSEDGGGSWQVVGFAGLSIKCLAMARDGSSLYVIPGSQNWETHGVDDPVDTRGGAEVWRMDAGNTGSWTRVMSTNTFFDNGFYGARTFFDIDVHPEDGSVGLVCVGDQLYRFTDGGTNQLILLPSGSRSIINLGYARYNPHNANHLIAVGDTFLHRWMGRAFLWSVDGGTNWHAWDAVDGGPDGTNTHLAQLVDYGPWNHHSSSSGYAVEKRSVVSNVYNYMQARVLMDFVREGATSSQDESTVVMWAGNFGKGPLMSTNYGASFRPFAHGGNFKKPSQLDFGQTDEVMGMAVTEHGFLLTGDGGRSWRAYHKYNVAALDPGNQTEPIPGNGTFAQRSAWGVASHPLNDDIWVGVYGYAPGIIVRTADFGASWEQVGIWRPQLETEGGDGLAWYKDGRVFWHGQNTNIVYAGNMKSVDGGNSFSTQMAHSVSGISITDGDWVVSKERVDWIWVSTNAGTSWVRLQNAGYGGATDGKTMELGFVSYRNVVMDPSPPAGRFRLLSGGEAGVWVYDAAVTNLTNGFWQKLSETVFEPDPLYADSQVWLDLIAIDPRPGFGHVVYATQGSPSNKQRGSMGYRQVYRSVDGGTNWIRMTDGNWQGELPDYLLPEVGGVSPSGNWTLGGYGGLFQLKKTGLDDWLEGAYGADWEERGHAGGLSDSDGDGYPAVIEYLVDTDPLTADASTVEALLNVQMRLDAGGWVGEVDVREGLDGVLVKGGVTGNLMMGWQSGTNELQSSVSNGVPMLGWQRFIFRDMTVSNAVSRFMRIAVDILP